MTEDKQRTDLLVDTALRFPLKRADLTIIKNKIYPF
jgi:hypothetical protein